MSARVNYETELRGISDNFVLMCRYIEAAIEKCVKALTERDFELAHEVYEEDNLINKMERDIEQSCLKILLMEHPVASDFHDVSAALKMITDLERIGDQAWDIMEITMQFNTDKYTSRLENIEQMAIIVIQMVKDGVQAYINRDLALAKSIAETDNKVDELFEIATNELVLLLRQKPGSAKQAVRLLMISKYFERIGDHAVNVGEWVEYAITGTHPKAEAEPRQRRAIRMNLPEAPKAEEPETNPESDMGDTD
jgi:phosphate transport system protein